MCGIAGLYNGEQPVGQLQHDLVARMLNLEQHRGPDGEGIRQLDAVVLGHRRLSIIDLTDCAAQPMSNETGSVWVSFNGEIYNYLELRQELTALGHDFRSTSDTEVLVHGYEEWQIEGLLERLRGMFAFALYDQAIANHNPERPFFFLARDRMGIKPLYYSWDNSSKRLTFASEVKALVRSGGVPGEVNSAAVAGFLCFGSVPYPQTCRASVSCLQPASFLALNRNKYFVRAFWDLTKKQSNYSLMADLLADTVRRHLLADVPVGVFLSGGVDSSVVAALAAKDRSAPLFTLTISFSESEFNEAADARRFAEHIGADHHEIPVSAADFVSEMPKILSAMDQPTADGVNTYFVSRAARQLGLKVVLSGLGGDEVFFGYSHYRSLVCGSGVLGAYAYAPAPFRFAAGKTAGVLGQVVGKEQWRRFDFSQNRSLNETLYLLVRGFFPPSQVSKLLGLSPKEVNAAVDQALSPFHIPGENGTVDSVRFQQLEMRRYMHDQLLRDSDVFSMAHSLELRVPLIDHEIIESASQIPIRRRIGDGINKPGLVEAVPDELLVETAKRVKRGFTFPFQSWLKAHANEFEDYAAEGDLLDSRAVHDCWQNFRSGRLHWSRAWSTVALRTLQ